MSMAYHITKLIAQKKSLKSTGIYINFFDCQLRK
jgi:hypothetical protein